MLRTLLILAAFLLAPLWGTDSFTSATAGTTVNLVANPLGFTQTGTYQVSGTFVATLQWQFSLDGRNWATYQTYTAAVGPILFSAPGYYRFNCSAFTSGTAVGTITPAPLIYQQYYATNGTLLYQLDDSGASGSAAGGGGGSGTVTSVAATVPSVLSISGSPITGSGTLAIGYSGTALPVVNGGTGLTAGIAGGVLGYTGTGTLASSGLLTANALLLGGGSAATPSALGSLGTTTTLLHGNAAGAPTFGAVGLTTDVTGTLPYANGGTNATTAVSAFDGMSGLTTLGDTLYGGASGTRTRLAGPTSGTQPYVWTSTPSGGLAQAPAWTVTTKNDLTKATAPGVSDDNTAGWTVGSVWLNTTTNIIYTASNVATGAAVWNQLKPGSFPYTDVFTAIGANTFTKHSGSTFIRVIIQGAGGGGGSGAFELTTVLAGGGGGAGGGDFKDSTFPASQVGSSETVTIADGGAGGLSQTVVTNSGNAGSTATVTSFGTTQKCWAQANGGLLGGAGTISAGGGGGAASSNTNTGGGAGGAGSSTTAAATNGTRPFLGGAGGGGGGAVVAANTESNGGGGAFSQLSSSYGSATGAGTAPGGTGSDGFQPIVAWPNAGGGGGGGAGGNAVAGGPGGAGGYGSGGGGGGGSHTTGSGAGGKGGQGVVVVISW